SRRRHTRFSRDWSSDVCSSDLVGLLQDRVHQGKLLVGEAVRYDAQRVGLVEADGDDEIVPTGLREAGEEGFVLRDGRGLHVIEEIGTAACRGRAKEVGAGES